MSNTSTIIDQIFWKTHSDRFISLETEITDVVTSLNGGDRISAENYSDRNKPRIWNEFVKRIDEEKRKNLEATFSVVDSDRLLLSWDLYVNADDNADLVEKKLRLQVKGALLRFFNDKSNIGSRQYEALGCLICELSGASKWHLTPSGNEFGIDFVALVPSVGNTHLFPSTSNQIRVVGQSKRWTSRVKREKVDYLANRLDYIRKRSHHVDRVLPAWFQAARGAIVGCMIAHSGTQSGGHIIANDQGIIISDTRDIAEIVALSDRWDVSTGSHGAIGFLVNELNTILSRD